MAIFRLVPAMEMIEFQKDDKFGPRIEELVTKIHGYVVTDQWTEKEVQDCKEIDQLEKHVFNRLGLRIAIDATQGMWAMAAILPFYANRNHIFIDKEYHGSVDIEEQTKLLNSLNGKRGTVDTQNAKLGGIFSEYTCPTYISFHVLFKDFKLSPGEVTAVILHELGHGFGSCEYSDRVASCNQVLSNVATELLKPQKSRKAEYVYQELLKVNPDTTKELAEEMIAGEKVVFGERAFRYMVDTVTYQLDNNKYDETSFENLSDSFAARFGYGRLLVSGLAKFQEQYDENQIRFIGHWVVVGLIISSFFLVAVMFTIGAPLAMLILLLYGCFGTYVLFDTAGEYGRDYTYDDIKIRYKRIRDQLVQGIKNGAFKGKDATRVVGDIEFIDKLVKDTGQYRSTLDHVMNFVRPANYRAKTSIQRQQLLETLANNNLFVQSLKLQTLA